MRLVDFCLDIYLILSHFLFLLYPQFWNRSLPRRFIVLFGTTRISQFLAALFPDVMFIWMMPCIFILLLLKHLNSPNCVVLLLMLFQNLEISLIVFDCDTKLRGLPVSTSYCNVVSIVGVSIQSSPSSDLLILLIFVCDDFSKKLTVPSPPAFRLYSMRSLDLRIHFLRNVCSSLRCFVFGSCMVVSNCSCINLVAIILVWFVNSGFVYCSCNVFFVLVGVAFLL